MSLDLGFTTLSGTEAVPARSPMERQARAAGARFERRDGWKLAVEYPGGHDHARGRVGWADVSHLRKLELSRTPDDLELGRARRREDAWWCPLTQTRTLVIGNGSAEGLDVTTSLAALTLVGPLARETIARFCALDLRPDRAPPGSLRPGSVARQPGLVIVEAPDRYLLLFGWATGEYMWSTVADAATHLGGGPIGVDALEALPAHPEEVQARA